MTDSTTPQDGKEMSPASDGSVSEPAAWGVLRVGGGWVSILANKAQAETSRKYFSKMESWVHEIIPLYRSPTLTDAEREAIWFFAAIDSNDPVLGNHAATLRGLLERLGGDK